MNKQEIEDFLNSKGDFVKIDHLTRFLKEDIPVDIKKFVYLKLAEIYEKKGMFNEAAKMFDNIALLSIAFSKKIKNYVKEAGLFIKAGYFDRADEAVRKAMGEANASEKAEIHFTIKEFYKKQALIYEKEKRRNHAARIYEKLLEMSLGEEEKQEIKKKLMELYDKLGRVRDYIRLKKGL